MLLRVFIFSLIILSNGVMCLAQPPAPIRYVSSNEQSSGALYSFKTFTSENGLTQNQIVALFQDSKGYIWLGSNGGGVARYDGVKFVNYSAKEGLINNTVWSIIEDKTGNIWVGTEGGISVLVKNSILMSKIKIINYTVDDGLVDNMVYKLFKDSKHNIWIGTNEGISKVTLPDTYPGHAGSGANSGNLLGKVDKGSGINFTNFTTDDGLVENAIRTIYEDQQGNLWFGTTGDGLNLLVPSLTDAAAENNQGNSPLFTTFTEQEGLMHNNVSTLFQDSFGYMWIGYWDGGISCYKPYKSMINSGQNGQDANNRYKLIVENEFLTAFSVPSILQDKRGNMWFATFGGGLLKRSHAEINNSINRFEHFSSKDGLGNNRIWSLMQDREGNLWVGTYGGGVSKLISRTYKIFTKKNGLSDDFIWSVIQDKNQNIWVGTNGGGVSVIPFRNVSGVHTDKFPTLNEKAGLADNRVYYMYEDSRSNIWLGTAGGLTIVRYNQVKGTIKIIKKITMKDGLIDHRVRIIFENKRGDIWIGTNEGISIIRSKNLKYAVNPFTSGKNKVMFENLTIDQGLIHSLVYSILEDMQGNIWIGTGGGVSLLKIQDLVNKNGVAPIFPEQAFEYFTVKDGLVNNDVRTVLEGKNGKLWFGTGGGISIYDPKSKKFENITSLNGLSSERLYFMHFDDDNNLWIGTNIGLDKFDLGEYREKERPRIKHLTHLDDFIEIETNTNAICEDNEGNLWFGTINGLVKYNPRAKKPKNTSEPLTHITNIKALGQDTILPQNATLPHDLNYLAFQYIGISLTTPEKVRYQYKLDGFDEKWSLITQETYAAFTNLSPGEYTFKVRACNNDGVWNKKPAFFSFVITPAFWQTWWFYGFCSAIGILVFISFIKIREKSLIKEKKILEQKVKINTDKVIQQKEKIQLQKDQLEQANMALREKNKAITFSINYANQIQQAILPKEEEIAEAFPEHFILYKPRDIVSGDFYWFNYAQSEEPRQLAGHSGERHAIIAAVDCTGHGVPGALMSMIGNALLNEIIIEKAITKPAEILQNLREKANSVLKQKADHPGTMYGMDIALCNIDLTNNILQYSGAYNPLYIIKQGENEDESQKEIPNYKSKIKYNIQIGNSIPAPTKSGSKTISPKHKAGLPAVPSNSGSAQAGNFKLIEVKADNFPIGINTPEKKKTFTNHKIRFKKGDTFYIFSNGYADQTGGPDGEKIMNQQFSQLLLDVQHLTMKEQHKVLDSSFENWRGNEVQVDDVLVIGVRL
ncbi:MAG: SpoIIE family protein phosphatase [Cytophagales bacterium]|nr:SpoIIE family protein phosphatase [Cytophagales bacterium]